MAGAFLALVLVVPPLVKLNYWQEGIAAALSQGLGRPVHFGEAHLRLVAGPGLEIANVVVEEDPRFGIEPFARMESLRAGVALRSLWQSGLQFSSLTFVRPSLNVVRDSEGRWNLESLGSVSGAARKIATPRSSVDSQPPHRFPPIQVDSGRINFKSQNQKEVFVLDKLDLDLTPPSSPSQPWRLRFEGTPDRTDAPLRAISRVRGEAELGPLVPGIPEETGTPVRLDLSAESALLDDWLRVFAGADYGVHGNLNFRLHLAGTTSLLRLSGKTSFQGLHRWDLLPPAAPAELRGEIAGFVDLKTDSLQLTSFSVPLSEGTVVIQGRIAKLFQQPQLDLETEFQRVSLAALFEIAQQFTHRLDPEFLRQGILDGSVRISTPPGALTGILTVSEGLVQEKGTPHRIRLSDFKIVLDGQTGWVSPFQARDGDGNELKASARWNLAKRASTLHLEGRGLPAASFLRWIRAFGSGWETVPLSEGDLALSVNISMSAAQAARLNGWAQISDAVLNPAALSSPIQVPAARLTFQKDQIRVKPFAAKLGEIHLQGSFSAQPSRPADETSSGPGRTWNIEFDCQASAVDLTEIERLVSDSARPSFFRSRPVTEPTDSLLRRVTAHGTLQIDSLGYRGFAMEHFKGLVNFRDRVLEIRRFSGEIADGGQTGNATIRFDPAMPSFTVKTKFAEVSLQKLANIVNSGVNSGANSGSPNFSGRLSGEIRLAGAGRTLEEIREHLGGSGMVSGHHLTIPDWPQAGNPESDPSPAISLSSFHSAFQIERKEFVIRDLRLALATPTVPEEASSEGSEWIATGSIHFDRRLNLWVRNTAADRYFHWTGIWSEPQIVESAVVPERALNALLSRK